MRPLTRLALAASLLPLATALSAQVANFNISKQDAEAHDCGAACQKRLSITTPADIDVVGRDLDLDFYATAGNFSTRHSKPGDVLKLQPINPKNLTLDGGPTSYRFQYVSVDADGSVVPVTGFISFPYTPHISPYGDGKAPSKYRLAAFAHGTVGVYPGCAPSNGPALYDYGSWQPALKRGYAVVGTDYAGLGNNYTSHKYLFLPAHANDVYYSVVAARKLFGARLTDEWVSFGHSQGGGAAWKLAESSHVRNDSSYLGTVAIAPASYSVTPLLEIAQQAVDGHNSSIFSNATRGAGFLAFFPIAVRRIIPSYNETMLTPLLRSRLVLADTAQLCLESILGLTLDVSLPECISAEGLLRDAPTLLRWEKMSAEAQGDRSPAPVLIIQGMADTAVMWNSTVRAWRNACEFGNEIHLRLFPTQGHRPSLSAGAPEWLAWMDGRFEERAAGISVGKRNCTKYIREPFELEYVRAPTDVDLKPYLGPLSNFQ